MIKRLFLFVLVCVMHTAMYAQTDTQSKAQMVFSNDFHDASGQLAISLHTSSPRRHGQT